MIILIFAIGIISNNYSNEPSSWAYNEVSLAKEEGIIDPYFEKDYTRPVSRADFARLCVNTIKSWYNIEGEITESAELNFIKDVTFLDTSNEDVLICANLGLVSGMDDGKFEPNRYIKRKEAALILDNLIKFIKYDAQLADSIPHSFKDGKLINSWCRDAVNEMYRLGILLGDSDNNYNPDDVYTREQAIASFLRISNIKNGSIADLKQQVDYYPIGDNAIYTAYENFYAYDNYNLQSFNAEYIDSNRNIYTNKDLGYIYPIDNNYQSVVLSTSESGNNVNIIDKNANILFDKIYKNAGVIEDSYGYLEEDEGCKIVDLTTREVIMQVDEFYKESLGNGLYIFVADGKQGILNKNMQVIIEPEYDIIKSTRAINDKFILTRGNKGYIVNLKGKFEKEFNINPNWNIVGVLGYCILYQSDMGTSYVYNAHNNRKTGEYNAIELLENGQILAYTSNYHIYILNQNLTEFMDVSALGYKNIIYIGNDLFSLLKDNGESDMADILNQDGKIIKSDINRSIIVDKSGVNAYIDKNEIVMFDCFGKELGRFNYSKYLSSLGRLDRHNIDFVNGLLFVTYYEGDKLRGMYILPNGKVFTNVNLSEPKV